MLEKCSLRIKDYNANVEFFEPLIDEGQISFDLGLKKGAKKTDGISAVFYFTRQCVNKQNE